MKTKRLETTVDKLPSPLTLVDERFMDVPAGVDLSFVNPVFKVLIFLEADHHLLIERFPLISLSRGDLVVLPRKARQIYRAKRKNSPSRIHALRILLDLPLVEESCRSRPRQRQSLGEFLVGSLSTVFHQAEFLTPRRHEQIARIREESEMRRPGYRFEIGHLVISLMIEAIRQMNPPASEGSSRAPTKSESAVERTKEYLAENLTCPLSLDDIAWQVRLSREHLARLFRATTGETVFQCLTRLRLEAAKSHLCNPNLLVLQVASRSGFESVPVFCRTFKRFMKMTPLAYRMQRMGEVQFSPSQFTKSPGHIHVIKGNLF